MGDRLTAKVAIITGSTAGIGRACAERFAEEGASVVVNGRRAALGQQVVEQIIARGGRACFVEGNMRLPETPANLVKYAVATFGRLDILVNNAYSGTSRSVVNATDEDWLDAFQMILKGAIISSRCAIPEMIKSGGGSIINMSSVHGIGAGRDNAVYNTFKAGLINLTRSMAVDYGLKGIRVNALCPGRILTEAKTEWLATNPTQAMLQELVYPLGRAGTMREAANAALFLASDESSFITGHALMVDGGMTAQLQDAVGAYVEAVTRSGVSPEDVVDPIGLP